MSRVSREQECRHTGYPEGIHDAGMRKGSWKKKKMKKMSRVRKKKTRVSKSILWFVLALI